MKLKDKYSSLFQFFAGYFHQDYDLDYPTTADAVRTFVHDANPETALRVSEDLRHLLQESNNDEALGQALYELGSCYMARFKSSSDPKWQSNREWLTKEVLAILDAHLAENRARSA